MSSEMLPRTISLRIIAQSFRGVILDIFGVLHDGVDLYPSVFTSLMNLRAAGTRICLLSNSPRRVSTVRMRLTDMGLHPDLYDGLVTSGELVHAALSGSMRIAGIPCGFRYLHAGPQELAGLLGGLPYQRTEDPAKADFILATGDVEEDTTWLLEARDRNLPMLCANPDVKVIVGGRPVTCAGALASRYEWLGGKVNRVGKPGSEAFIGALRILDLPRSKVIMIGDGMATDIAGANRSGIASALALSGIHHNEIDFAREAGVASFFELCKANQASPDYLLNHFSWDEGR